MILRGLAIAIPLVAALGSACAAPTPVLPATSVPVPPTSAPAATASLAPTLPATAPAAPATVTRVPAATATASFTLTSSAFAEGANIPPKFTCSGENASPPLSWRHAPANTKSFALIMDDPDAPAGIFTHWVAFDIPPTQTEIAAGANRAGKSGKNSAGRNEYMGPCPPSGTHRYFFKLYALDLPSLGLNDGASRSDVEKAIAGHAIAETRLMGRYSK